MISSRAVASARRWARAMVWWHVMVLREEMRHYPASRSTWLALLVAGAFVYVPLIAIGTKAMMGIALQEGLNPQDAAVWPLAYAFLLALMIGGAVTVSERWWVIRISPAPRWLLGMDRALGVYAFTLAAVGPYAWGALQGSALSPVATFSLVALALALGARVRLAGRLGYLVVVVLSGLMGWAYAFFVKKYLEGFVPVDDPNHELAREFLKPIFLHGHMPEPLLALLGLPALAHVALAFLALIWLARGLREGSGNEVWRAPLRWLGRWRDAASAYAWARLLQVADSGIAQAVAAASFALALEAYGVARVPRSFSLWLVLTILWRPIWVERLELPEFLQAGTIHPAKNRRLLLEGRLMALAQSSFVLFLVFGRPLIGLLLTALVLLFRFFPGVLLAVPAGWPRGLVVAVLGGLLSWWGG